MSNNQTQGASIEAEREVIERAIRFIESGSHTQIASDTMTDELRKLLSTHRTPAPAGLSQATIAGELPPPAAYRFPKAGTDNGYYYHDTLDGEEERFKSQWESVYTEQQVRAAIEADRAQQSARIQHLTYERDKARADLRAQLACQGQGEAVGYVEDYDLERFKREGRPGDYLRLYAQKAPASRAFIPLYAAPASAQPAVPSIVREAIEATFGQRPGYLTLIAAAVRAIGETGAQPGPAEVTIERNRVWIINGNQSFMLAYVPDEGDDPAEMQVYADNLRAALTSFKPDVNSAGAQPARGAARADDVLLWLCDQAWFQDAAGHYLDLPSDDITVEDTARNIRAIFDSKRAAPHDLAARVVPDGWAKAMRDLVRVLRGVECGDDGQWKFIANVCENAEELLAATPSPTAQPVAPLAPVSLQGAQVGEHPIHVGTLSVFEDREATFGFAYDISTNAAGHRLLQELDGAELYAVKQPHSTATEGADGMGGTE